MPSIITVMGANGKIPAITIVLRDEISLTVPGLVNWRASASLADRWGVVVVGCYRKVSSAMLCDEIALGVPVRRVAGVGA